MKGLNKMTFIDIYGMTGLFILAGMLFYYMYRTNKKSYDELRRLRNME
jgi:hypothetical protein